MNRMSQVSGVRIERVAEIIMEQPSPTTMAEARSVARMILREVASPPSPKSREQRRRDGERWLRRGGSPEGTGNGSHDLWGAWEIVLARDLTMTHRDVAERIGRTPKAVKAKRIKHGWVLESTNGG